MDKQLNETEQKSLEAHLENCPACLKRLEKMVQYRQALLNASELTPPKNFYRGVMNQIHVLEWRSPLLIATWCLRIGVSFILLFGIILTLKTYKQFFMPGIQLVQEGLRKTESFSRTNTTPKGGTAAPPVEPTPLQSSPESVHAYSTLKSSYSTAAPRQASSQPTSASATVRKQVPPSGSATPPPTTPGAMSIQPVLKHLVTPVQPNENNPGGTHHDEPSDIPASPASEQHTSTTQVLAQNPSASPREIPSDVHPDPTQSLKKPEPGVPKTNKALTNTIAEWKGSYCAMGTPSRVIITSTPQWQKLWQVHSRVGKTPLALPRIDFKHYEIVGVYAGQKPAKGYSIKIEDVRKTPQALIVSYREYTPAQGSPPAGSSTQPFHLRVIRKTTLPIRFRRLP
jgi:hypothetical protein